MEEVSVERLCKLEKYLQRCEKLMAVGEFHRFYKFTDKIDFVKIIGFNASSFGFSYEVTVKTLDAMDVRGSEQCS